MKKMMLAMVLGCMVSTSGFSAVTSADENALVSGAQQSLQKAFGPKIQVQGAAMIAGGQILEVTLNTGQSVYMTPDMSHLFVENELYRLSDNKPVNVTQERMKPKRAEYMANVADKDTVIFKAKGDEKALINVFTDIDCGYCQKLHQEIPQLNELGITVRYLAYPRAGIRDHQTGELTQSFRKINYVWCQDDRTEAMNDMKTTQREVSTLARQVRAGDSSGQDEYQKLQRHMMAMIETEAACDAPIEEQFQLGFQVGVRGTPSIVSEQGDFFPGYLPANELASRLGVL